MTETRREADKQQNHVALFFKTWWFLLMAGFSGAGILISMWFQLQYVIAAVNPDSLAEYGVIQAKLEVKREVRWCLVKLVWSTELSRVKVLECAD